MIATPCEPGRLRRGRADDRLRVRADDVAETRGDPREARAEQEPPCRARRRPGRPGRPARPRRRRVHAPGRSHSSSQPSSRRRSRRTSRSARISTPRRSASPGQDEGPADAAAAAVRAPDAARALPAEVRVGDCDAGLAEEDSDVGRPDSVLDAHPPCDLAHDEVGRRLGRNGGCAEHPPRGAVVRRQLRAPVGEPGPLRVVEERSRGSTSVFAYTSEPPPTPAPERTSTSSRSVSRWIPQPSRGSHRNRRRRQLVREVLRPPAPPGLEQDHSVALLGEPAPRPSPRSPSRRPPRHSASTTACSVSPAPRRASARPGCRTPSARG